MFKVQNSKFKVIGPLRIPHFALVLLVASVSFIASGQIPTNNISPTTLHVITDSNGHLLAPTNLWSSNAAAISAAIGSGSNFATNLAGVVQPVNGGLGTANTNWVPAGLQYSAVPDDNEGQYFAHVFGFNTNLTYFAIITNGNNDEGLYWDTNYYVGGLGGSGFFRPTNTVLEIFGDFPSVPVDIQIYQSNAPIAGTFLGNGSLTLDGSSVVPDQALSANVAFNNRVLSIVPRNNNSEHFLFSSNNSTGGGNGSTLSLDHMGSYGYSDINFRTQGYNPANYAIGSTYGLQFALGCTDPSSPYFPYAAGPYMELYNAGIQSFFWLHAGYGSTGNGYIGGIRSNAFFISQDGSTNNDAFVIYPKGAGAGAPGITNYLNVSCVSNVTINSLTVTNAPTFQATNAGAGITVGTTAPKLFFSITNNGVAYKVPAY